MWLLARVSLPRDEISLPQETLAKTQKNALRRPQQARHELKGNNLPTVAKKYALFNFPKIFNFLKQFKTKFPTRKSYDHAMEVKNEPDHFQLFRNNIFYSKPWFQAFSLNYIVCIPEAIVYRAAKRLSFRFIRKLTKIFIKNLVNLNIWPPFALPGQNCVSSSFLNISEGSINFFFLRWSLSEYLKAELLNLFWQWKIGISENKVLNKVTPPHHPRPPLHFRLGPFYSKKSRCFFAPFWRLGTWGRGNSNRSLLQQSSH